jgi:hypothetical protein
MYKIGVYVPESHLEAVKAAMFEKGGGRYRDYDMCSWQALGTGQFRPSAHARPHVGSPGILEQIPEYRLEMVCTGKALKDVIRAMLDVHPYEEPAYDIVGIKTIEDF